MNIVKVWVAIGTCLCVTGMSMEASTTSWTGGGDGTSFSDPANWSRDPGFSGSDVLVSTNIHRIAMAAEVTTGDQQLNYPSTQLDHPGAVFTIPAGSSVVNAGGLWAAGTINISGSLDTGAGVISSGVTQEDIVINVEEGGYFRALGNNAYHGNLSHNRNVSVNIRGEAQMKLNLRPKWKSPSANNTFTVRLYPGGVYQVGQAGMGNINLQCDADSSSRIELHGGFLNVGKPVQYNYLSMTNAPGNGIVFMESSSAISVAGNSVQDVMDWKSAGALSSEVPGSEIVATYHAASNVTMVVLSMPATE